MESRNYTVQLSVLRRALGLSNLPWSLYYVGKYMQWINFVWKTDNRNHECRVEWKHVAKLIGAPSRSSFGYIYGSDGGYIRGYIRDRMWNSTLGGSKSEKEIIVQVWVRA